MKILFLSVIFITLLNQKIYANDPWILWWIDPDKDTAIDKIREWNISITDIPKMLNYAVDFLLWIAWTIAIIFIIIWWYKLAFWSLQNDKSKWKETITLAIAWFILAALSWIILKIIIDNFT